MMTAVVLVSIALTLVVIFGLVGQAQPGSGPRFSEIAMTMIPVVTVAGAAAMAAGFTITGLCVYGLTVLAGVLAAVLPGSPISSRLVRVSPVSTGLGWFCALAVLLGLGGMALAWLSNLIATFTTLNATIVALLLTLTGIAAGIGGRGRLGQSRIGTGIVIAGAVLLAIGGILAGSASGLADPGVVVGNPGLFGYVIFPIAVVIAASAHPGLRKAAAISRRPCVTAAILMAVVPTLGLLGVLMLAGGAFEVPSVQLDTFVAYVPGAAGGVLAGLFALIAGTTASQTVNVALDASRDLGAQVPIPVQGAAGRAGATALMGLVLFVVAATQPDPKWLVPALAAAGVIGFISERVARRRNPGSETDPPLERSRPPQASLTPT